MFSGYLDWFKPPAMACATISNHQDFPGGETRVEARDAFDHIRWQESRPLDVDPTYIQRIGICRAMQPSDLGILRDFLKQRKPPEAIIGKSVDLFHQIADRPAAQGGIGKRISAIYLPRDGPGLGPPTTRIRSAIKRLCPMLCG